MQLFLSRKYTLSEFYTNIYKDMLQLAKTQQLSLQVKIYKYSFAKWAAFAG